MRQSIASAPTRATNPRIWALLEALAYAGAILDPTGALVAHRFRSYRKESHDG
jgi:hypothetical protein